MMRDEKLVSAAVRSKQPIERVVWIWGAILESAAEINDNGKFALDTAEIAYFLRAEQADLDRIVSALEELGRIAGDCVVKWGDRQFTSDRSADRTRAYRDRQKGQAGEDHNVTKGGDAVTVTVRDDVVTSPQRHCDAPETETEAETEAKTERKKDSRAKRPSASEDFDRIWRKYPRRKGNNPRKPALRAFEAAVASGASPQIIEAGLDRDIANWTAAKEIGTRFIPQAVTWFHQARWDDHADLQAEEQRVVGVPIQPGTEQFRAWLEHFPRRSIQHSLMVRSDDTGQPYYAPAEWPPDSPEAASA